MSTRTGILQERQNYAFLLRRAADAGRFRRVGLAFESAFGLGVVRAFGFNSEGSSRFAVFHRRSRS
jgi:hypothetical protein